MYVKDKANQVKSMPMQKYTIIILGICNDDQKMSSLSLIGLPRRCEHVRPYFNKILNNCDLKSHKIYIVNRRTQFDVN